MQWVMRVYLWLECRLFDTGSNHNELARKPNQTLTKQTTLSIVATKQDRTA